MTESGFSDDMVISTQHDLEAMRRAGRLAATILKQMLEHARAGMTTGELDAFGEALMDQAGARSAPRLAAGFPAGTCISVNEEVAHGIPGERALERGDVLNIDVSLELNGYFADNAYTVVIEPDERERNLLQMCRQARQARDHAISLVRHGSRLSVIGRVLEQHARKAGFVIVKNLCSHGIGKSLHEEPEEVLGYFDRRDRRAFNQGMALTIEPFFSTSSRWVEEAEDGWTLMNRPGGRSAQYEHTLIVRRNRPPEILTPLDFDDFSI